MPRHSGTNRNGPGARVDLRMHVDPNMPLQTAASKCFSNQIKEAWVMLGSRDNIWRRVHELLQKRNKTQKESKIHLGFEIETKYSGVVFRLALYVHDEVWEDVVRDPNSKFHKPLTELIKHVSLDYRVDSANSTAQKVDHDAAKTTFEPGRTMLANKIVSAADKLNAKVAILDFPLETHQKNDLVHFARVNRVWGIGSWGGMQSVNTHRKMEQAAKSMDLHLVAGSAGEPQLAFKGPWSTLDESPSRRERNAIQSATTAIGKWVNTPLDVRESGRRVERIPGTGSKGARAVACRSNRSMPRRTKAKRFKKPELTAQYNVSISDAVDGVAMRVHTSNVSRAATACGDRGITSAWITNTNQNKKTSIWFLNRMFEDGAFAFHENGVDIHFGLEFDVNWYGRRVRAVVYIHDSAWAAAISTSNNLDSVTPLFKLMRIAIASEQKYGGRSPHEASSDYLPDVGSVAPLVLALGAKMTIDGIPDELPIDETRNFAAAMSLSALGMWNASLSESETERMKELATKLNLGVIAGPPVEEGNNPGNQTPIPSVVVNTTRGMERWVQTVLDDNLADKWNMMGPGAGLERRRIRDKPVYENINRRRLAGQQSRGNRKTQRDQPRRTRSPMSPSPANRALSGNTNMRSRQRFGSLSMEDLHITTPISLSGRQRDVDNLSMEHFRITTPSPERNGDSLHCNETLPYKPEFGDLLADPSVFNFFQDHPDRGRPDDQSPGHRESNPLVIPDSSIATISNNNYGSRRMKKLREGTPYQNREFDPNNDDGGFHQPAITLSRDQDARSKRDYRLKEPLYMRHFSKGDKLPRTASDIPKSILDEIGITVVESVNSHNETGYTAKANIGSGSFASVCEVVDRPDLVWRTQPIGDLRHIQGIRDTISEIRVTRLLSNNEIAPSLKACFMDEYNQVFVMDRYDSDLSTFLNNNPKLRGNRPGDEKNSRQIRYDETDEAREPPDWARQCMDLFRRTADLGVFCSDIKPTNIVVRDLGYGSLDVRLIDFGTDWCITDPNYDSTIGYTCMLLTLALTTNKYNQVAFRGGPFSAELRRLLRDRKVARGVKGIFNGDNAYTLLSENFSGVFDHYMTKRNTDTLPWTPEFAVNAFAM